jgi:hypothetical protein
VVLQSLCLALVLAADLAVVSGARADLRADRGAGVALRVAPVPEEVSPPVRLGIPQLGLTTRLIGLGPAVIVGHVDSVDGPGVFARLRELEKGAQIRVRRADGSLGVFVVTQVQQYAKRDFPTDVVYRGEGRSSLRLITCGGDFDRRSGRYRGNVVVFAKPA